MMKDKDKEMWENFDKWNHRMNEKTKVSALDVISKIKHAVHFIQKGAMSGSKEAMAGLLDPLLKDVVTGQAEVRKIFDLSKGGNIAGCAVTSGKIVRGKMRVVRKGDLVYEGISHTLKRFKDEVNEVRTGMECGIRLDGFDDFKESDIIECYMQEKVAQKL